MSRSLTYLLTHSKFLMEGNLMTKQFTWIKLGILWDNVSTQLSKNVTYDVFNCLLKDMWKAFINGWEQVIYILWFPYLGGLDLKYFLTLKNKNFSILGRASQHHQKKKTCLRHSLAFYLCNVKRIPTNVRKKTAWTKFLDVCFVFKVRRNNILLTFG